MPAKLENSAVATGLEKVIFIQIPKKGNAKECSNYYTIVLISHASKVMLNSPSQASTVNLNHDFPMFKLDLEKAEEPEIKLPASVGSWKKQESSRKTSISALLSMPKPKFIVDHNKLWKILKDHLTCLLRNLYAGQKEQLELDLEQ